MRRIASLKKDVPAGTSLRQSVDRAIEHLRRAEEYLERSESEGDPELLRDVVLRCNTAFEGLLRAWWSASTCEDGATRTIRLFDIEQSLTQSDKLPPRTRAALTFYRQHFRNTVTHDHLDEIGSGEAHAAINIVFDLFRRLLQGWPSKNRAELDVTCAELRSEDQKPRQPRSTKQTAEIRGDETWKNYERTENLSREELRKEFPLLIGDTKHITRHTIKLELFGEPISLVRLMQLSGGRLAEVEHLIGWNPLHDEDPVQDLDLYLSLAPVSRSLTNAPAGITIPQLEALVARETTQRIFGQTGALAWASLEEAREFCAAASEYSGLRVMLPSEAIYSAARRMLDNHDGFRLGGPYVLEWTDEERTEIKLEYFEHEDKIARYQGGRDWYEHEIDVSALTAPWHHSDDKWQAEELEDVHGSDLSVRETSESWPFRIVVAMPSARAASCTRLSRRLDRQMEFEPLCVERITIERDGSDWSCQFVRAAILPAGGPDGQLSDYWVSLDAVALSDLSSSNSLDIPSLLENVELDIRTRWSIPTQWSIGIPSLAFVRKARRAEVRLSVGIELARGFDAPFFMDWCGRVHTPRRPTSLPLKGVSCRLLLSGPHGSELPTRLALHR